MKILVTGGAGFIGSNLAYRLLDLGGDVLVVDDLSTGSFENIDPRSGFRTLDILDDAFTQAVLDYQPDCIVHLAAQPSVVRSVAEPEFTHLVNAEGTRRVAQAAKACGAERVIFASTAAVYGMPPEIPLRETSPTVPINPYGDSKLSGERILEEELRGSGTDFAILRFANVYGPRQSVVGEGGVVAAFCDTLARGEVPFIEGDGGQIRDFIFVGDVVTALVSAIGGEIVFAQEQGTPAAGIYNICTGDPTSIKALAGLMRGITLFAGEYGTAPAREGDIRESVLDGSKALEVFEFSPAVELEDGLALTWKWFAAKHGVSLPGTQVDIPEEIQGF